MEKVILTDIDGVLATAQCFDKPRHNKWEVYPFDEKCVKVYNEILEESGADIVISSDWRSYFSFEHMCEIFEWNGVSKTPVAFTPSSHEYLADQLEWGRTCEIKAFVEEHKPKIWVAVDDLNMHELDFFVHCSRINEGIKQTGIKKKILKILNAR